MNVVMEEGSAAGAAATQPAVAPDEVKAEQAPPPLYTPSTPFGSTAPKHPHRGHLNTKRAEESAPPMGWPPGLVPAEPPLPPARSPKKAGGVAAVGRYQL